MNDTLDHFSISSLQTYDRCNLQWYYRYVLGSVVPPGVSLVIGKGFHKAEEENFRSKLASGVDLACNDVLERFSHEYDEGIKDARMDEEDDPGKIKDQAIRAVELFHTEVAPKIYPVAVEEEHRVEIAGYPFVARMDLIDKYEAIHDLKCVGKTPNESDVLYSQQLTAYDLVYRKVHKRPPKKLWLDYAVRLKTPKVLQRPVDPRPDSVIEAFEDEVALKREAITKGIFLPADVGSWVCSRKWCGWYDLCKYGARRKGS